MHESKEGRGRPEHHPKEQAEEPERRGRRETGDAVWSRLSEWFVLRDSDLICPVWSHLGLGVEWRTH